MKSYFCKEKIKYTGEQLKPLTNYLKHGVLGDSVVAWIGPCQVQPQHMIDGEDVRAGDEIASDEMVHFVLELFFMDIKAGVFLQRLMAEMTVQVLKEFSPDPRIMQIQRKGDDLYYKKQKLNISIATISAQSCLLHFAVNVVSTGAPVPVLSLQDFKIPSKKFALRMLELLEAEIEDSLAATFKVRTF